jgi:diaminopimelate epimerase
MTKRAKPLVFYKMHGLGNDFMVVEAVTQSVQLKADDIARWGDRNTGVGFDQLLLIEPPTSADADFWYRVYNADGSRAEQCGNGTRCVALLVQHLHLSKKNTLHWQSEAGLLRTDFASPQQIETTMTVPVLDLAEIPFAAEHAEPIATAISEVNQFSLEADGEHYNVTPVSMGNPHGVMFMDDIFSVDVPTIGAKLTNHPAFPQGANIGFCQVIDRHFLRLRVFERGVGETRACGTGACAAVVAAHRHELVDTRVKVSLPGGKLRITWPEVGSPVTMSGSASLVFRGEVHF